MAGGVGAGIAWGWLRNLFSGGRGAIAARGMLGGEAATGSLLVPGLLGLGALGGAGAFSPILGTL